jgi:NADH-quinone oxidoreductase subunit H
MEFLSSSSFLLPFFGFLKAFFVAMFGLNLGVILTWVERRMRGMIQDSIGPNRAAIPLPGPVAAGLAVGPALLGAAAVVALWVSLRAEGETAGHAGWGMIFTQSAVFLIWAFTAIMARVVRAGGAQGAFEEQFADLGEPRSIVLVGLLTHLAVFALGVATVGTSYAASFTDLSFSGGMALLVVAMVGSAGYVASRLFGEKEVRLTLLGLLHPAADGVKTAFKNDFEPAKGDKLLYQLAPWISFCPVLVLIAVVPFGPALCFGMTDGAIDFSAFQGIEAVGHACESGRFSLQVADLDVGILYFFAVAGTSIVGAALAGWASDNKFSLLGGMRAASQMVSYEVTLGLTVIGSLMIYGTVRIEEMVLWQAENAWGIFVQPLGFFLFLAAAIAETKRVPFDIPEGESEIVAGYFTEYAGMKFALFFFAEFVAVIASSTLMVALFFGGWHLPFATATGIDVKLGEVSYFAASIEPSAMAVLGFVAMLAKVIGMCAMQIVIRWTLPRFRYDQLMRLGWRKLLPASLVNVMLTATVILAIQSASTKVQTAVTWLGQLSMLALVLATFGSLIALVVFLMTPRQKQRLVVSSSARYAEAMGGVHSSKMEA